MKTAMTIQQIRNAAHFWTGTKEQFIDYISRMAWYGADMDHETRDNAVTIACQNAREVWEEILKQN